MGAKRERAARPEPERAEGVRAFRGIMIAVAASIVLFWVPLAVALVLLVW
jgi:hypothetical protein